MNRVKQPKWHSVSALLVLLIVPLNAHADKNMVLIVGEETRNERAATLQTDVKQASPAVADTIEEQPPQHALKPLTKPSTRKDNAFEFITFENVLFAHNSSALDNRAKQILSEIAAHLDNNEKAKRLLISGFANKIASDDYNIKLSAKRAFVVREYLRHIGVSPSLLHTAGWGESFPADEHWTHSGRKRNRRVELYLVQN